MVLSRNGDFFNGDEDVENWLLVIHSFTVMLFFFFFLFFFFSYSKIKKSIEILDFGDKNSPLWIAL